MSVLKQSFLLASGISGAMIYDSQWRGKIQPEHFDQSYWVDKSDTQTLNGGRGETYLIQPEFSDKPWVLRHNLRGGLYGRIVDRSYLYTGEDRVRSFLEWRVLQDIAYLQPQVVKPIAAIYWKYKLNYRAALITEFVPNSVTLGQMLINQQDIHWGKIAKVVRGLHDQDVVHGDLNCHNILVTPDDEVTLIDFDKSRTLDGPPPNRDKQVNSSLQRLKRSILKVSNWDIDRLSQPWEEFEGAYSQTTKPEGQVQQSRGAYTKQRSTDTLSRPA